MTVVEEILTFHRGPLNLGGIRPIAGWVSLPMMKRIVAAALAAGLLLAACGGAGSSSNLPAGVVLPEPAPGPVPELAVSPEAALSSPLPEIAVRRLNGEGGWVQLKNELPADKPLLVWFWAPH